MVAEETTQVDFIIIEKAELTNKEDKLKAALTKLFPCILFVNLRHLKPM